eukprot:CAMPEP_0177570208 /NCGR_PEP_ID=MMETSP0369-20130122/76716_1 /TAXON_ID=447022 ORGANISM="Scrippsiella hangoei-like, Strain SHHI-4" /NCGR_SAMPLE_ID=MMETSP0369 /ASSEMBLY_ACC=CAM_ASM_000364 /LENGTH=61 /DNA_ID=CAMNT_0019057927 /DNA_START=68 /DNA_END=249 /DNA_ORIENTATION=-
MKRLTPAAHPHVHQQCHVQSVLEVQKSRHIPDDLQLREHGPQPREPHQLHRIEQARHDSWP